MTWRPALPEPPVKTILFPDDMLRSAPVPCRIAIVGLVMNLAEFNV